MATGSGSKGYVIQDLKTGKQVTLRKYETKTIGRNSTNDLQTQSPGLGEGRFVTGLHATISYESDGQVYLVDNKSTNGTFIESPISSVKLEEIVRKTRLNIKPDVPYLFYLGTKKYPIQISGPHDLESKRSQESKERPHTGDTEVNIEIPPELKQN